MRKDTKKPAIAVMEQIKEIRKDAEVRPGPNEAISGSDLRARYSRLPDSLKKPVELAHLIALLGVLVDQMAQTPPEFLKEKDIRS
jgi:hypothetical protein